jgi:hypothetical protein
MQDSLRALHSEDNSSRVLSFKELKSIVGFDAYMLDEQHYTKEK